MQRNNMKPERLQQIVKEEINRVIEQEAARIGLNEAKVKKGDIIKMADGEYGVVNKVSGRVAYIKLPSMPKSFHPIEAARITYKGKHKGRDLYSESLNEAAMEFGVEYRDAKGKPKKKNEPVVMRFKTKPSADKFAKKGNQMDKVGGKYTVVRVQVEENVAPDHDGKSAPYGSGYKKEKDLTEATDLWKKFDEKQRLYSDAMDVEMDLKTITKDIGQLHKDMEQEAEPEGGKVSNRYGKQIDTLEKSYKKKKAEFKKMMAKIDKLEQY